MNIPGCGLLKGPSGVCVTPNNRNASTIAVIPLKKKKKKKTEIANSDAKI